MVRVLRLHGDDAPGDVDVLEATIDDMTGEEIAFLTDELRRAGARDVFTTPVLMKKGRPGVTVTVLATAGEGAAFADVFFARSTTLGVRLRHETRVTLERAVHTIDTELGPVRVKVVRGPGGTRMTPEQDDVDAIARARDLSLRDVVARVEAAWRTHPSS